MSKFKIGDKVKLVRPGSCGGDRKCKFIGQEGVILKVSEYGNHWWDVRFDIDFRCAYHSKNPKIQICSHPEKVLELVEENSVAPASCHFCGKPSHGDWRIVAFQEGNRTHGPVCLECSNIPDPKYGVGQALSLIDDSRHGKVDSISWIKDQFCWGYFIPETDSIALWWEKNVKPTVEKKKYTEIDASRLVPKAEEEPPEGWTDGVIPSPWTEGQWKAVGEQIAKGLDSFREGATIHAMSPSLRAFQVGDWVRVESARYCGDRYGVKSALDCPITCACAGCRGKITKISKWGKDPVATVELLVGALEKPSAVGKSCDYYLGDLVCLPVHDLKEGDVVCRPGGWGKDGGRGSVLERLGNKVEILWYANKKTLEWVVDLMKVVDK
jgi:hypothetical protein